MPGLLPDKPIAATRINPKIMVLYGFPKVGKTEQLIKLPECLILDSEKGAEGREALRVPIGGINFPANPIMYEDGPYAGQIKSMSLNSAFQEIEKDGKRQLDAGVPVGALKYPYRRIAFDTLDKIEDFCERSATAKYKASAIGKTFEGNSVLELPNGGGYFHLRNEVMFHIERWATVCETLILITHIKEKLLDKGGVNVSSVDISLTGKLSSIVCAAADVIGYLYYPDPKKPLHVSFETNESAVMGARFPRLAGKRFEFSWDKIFVDEATK